MFVTSLWQLLFTEQEAGAALLLCTKLGALSKGRCVLTLLTNSSPSRFSITAPSASSVNSSIKPFSFACAAVHQLVSSIHPATSSLSLPVFFTYRPTMLSRMAFIASMYFCNSSAL